MDGPAQLAWIATAVDALEDIRADEVRAVSAEVRRSVTRPAQIVPEITRLVADRRARRHMPSGGKPDPDYWIENGNRGLREQGRHDLHWVYDKSNKQYRIEAKD